MNQLETTLLLGKGCMHGAVPRPRHGQPRSATLNTLIPSSCQDRRVSRTTDIASQRNRRSSRVLTVSLNETDLVTMARAGYNDAFEELVGRHRKLICSVCGRMAANREDAEDGVQLVLVAIWKNLHSFEGRSKFATWLYPITINTMNGILRRHRVEQVELDDQTPTAGTDHSEAISDADAIQWALAQLPAEFRATFVLREFEGLSIEEIAGIQFISEGTVKSRLGRSRQALAYLLKDREP